MCYPAATEEDMEAGANSGAHTPTAIILEPSRDLAKQTHDNIVEMSRQAGCRSSLSRRQPSRLLCPSMWSECEVCAIFL